MMPERELYVLCSFHRSIFVWPILLFFLWHIEATAACSLISGHFSWHSLSNKLYPIHNSYQSKNQTNFRFMALLRMMICFDNLKSTDYICIFCFFSQLRRLTFVNGNTLIIRLSKVKKKSETIIPACVFEYRIVSDECSWPLEVIWSRLNSIGVDSDSVIGEGR